MRRGSEPCSSPSTKTVSKRRVRARIRSSTATRPGSPGRAPRTVARSSAATTSSRRHGTPRRTDTIELVEHSEDGVERAQVGGGLVGRLRAPPSRAHCGRAMRRPPGSAAIGIVRLAQARPGTAADDRREARRRPRRHAPGSVTARPRSRPSTKSTSLRGMPENGERRKPNSALRSARPPRRSATGRGARGRAECDRGGPVASIATGTPRPANAASRARRTGSTDGATTAISSGATPCATSSSASSATSSSVARRPAPSRKRTAPSSGMRGGSSSNRWRSRCASDAGRWRSDGRGQSHHLFGECSQVVSGARERLVHDASGLVGQRDVHLPAGRERLDQAPLRAGQVLEPVREHRSAVPGRRDRPSGARPPPAVARRDPTARACRAGRGTRLTTAAELAGRDRPRVQQRRADLADRTRRGPPRIRRNVLDGDVGRVSRPRGGRAGREPAPATSGLPGSPRASASEAGPGAGTAPSKVEIRPPTRPPARGQEIALDELDVRPVRHDEPRITIEHAR